MWFKRFLLVLLIAIGFFLTWVLPQASSSSTLLLCPVCSGQGLFESDHPLAVAIRNQVAQWESEGWSQSAIIRELREIYGSAIEPIRWDSAQTLLHIILLIVGVRYGFQRRS